MILSSATLSDSSGEFYHPPGPQGDLSFSIFRGAAACGNCAPGYIGTEMIYRQDG
jgi:hypothetical protein